MCREMEIMRDRSRAEGLAEGLAKGMVEGHAKGMLEGLAEGELKAKRESAISLHHLGMDVSVKATSENRLPAGSKRACRSVNPLHL